MKRSLFTLPCRMETDLSLRAVEQSEGGASGLFHDRKVKEREVLVKKGMAQGPAGEPSMLAAKKHMAFLILSSLSGIAAAIRGTCVYLHAVDEGTSPSRLTTPSTSFVRNNWIFYLSFRYRSSIRVPYCPGLFNKSAAWECCCSGINLRARARS